MLFEKWFIRTKRSSVDFTHNFQYLSHSISSVSDLKNVSHWTVRRTDCVNLATPPVIFNRFVGRFRALIAYEITRVPIITARPLFRSRFAGDNSPLPRLPRAFYILSRDEDDNCTIYTADYEGGKSEWVKAVRALLLCYPHARTRIEETSRECRNIV